MYLLACTLARLSVFVGGVQDEGVAMEACEFWWEFLKNSESAEFLLLQHEAAGAESVLSSLIPALISRFPLTTEQVLSLVGFVDGVSLCRCASLCNEVLYVMMYFMNTCCHQSSDRI